MKARAKLLSGETVDVPLQKKRIGDVITVSPELEDYTNVQYLDLGYDYGCAKVGDAGYFALARGRGSEDDHICRYVEGPDAQVISSDLQLSMYGFIRNGQGYCAIVTGYTYEFQVVQTRVGEDYSIYARFPIGGKTPYEKIEVEFHLLAEGSADYSGIARTYRRYLMDRIGCRPISQRLTPELEYARDSLYIRIRMAWKPVPSPVEEQTPETEPPLHVAMTFAQVEELMEKCKAAGVKKAEFCLVGWNISGHDGRWPQYFPVEPKLGGEEGLRRLIKTAKTLGYQITCHTNTTDSYSIADSYSPAITCKKPDGSIYEHGVTWGGGRPKWVCPSQFTETVKREFPKLQELGFRGLHYIDVISTIATYPCYDAAHPQTKRQCAQQYKACAKLSAEMFGGFSSEGGYDHTAPYLDYGLYISFFDTEGGRKPALFTESVPLWQIALHGITLSNPYCATVNAPIKSRRHQLEVVERGGRPTVYIYSAFHSKRNWMGEDDIVCTTPADMEKTVSILAAMYREFEPMAYLQSCFIDRHEVVDGVARTYYSDGSVVCVDFEKGTYTVEK